MHVFNNFALFVLELSNLKLLMTEASPVSILRNFAMIIGKHLCWSLSLIKLHTFKVNDKDVIDVVLVPLSLTLKTCNFKKRLHYRCFPVNIAKSLRTCIL